jgi:hypothetical protein
MNIIEAVKTGLPFKRKHWKSWHNKGLPYVTIETCALLADDWIVEEEKKTITFEQLANAIPLVVILTPEKFRPLAEQIWENLK